MIDTLKEYTALKAEAERIEERIEELETRLTSIKIKLDGMPRGSGSINVMEAQIISLIDQKSRYMDILKRLTDKQKEAEDLIEKLPSRERDIIRRRYIYGDSIIRISDEVGYSRSRIYGIIKGAIKKAP